jgi:hypothetical protein
VLAEVGFLPRLHSNFLRLRRTKPQGMIARVNKFQICSFD